MASKVWKGFLKCSLLTIPVYLNVAAREQKIEFHTIHNSCRNRLKSPQFCPGCARNVEKSEVQRVYDAPNGVIEINDDELQAIAPLSDKTMEVTEFVKWENVDPKYLAESFYVLPEETGTKAYSLFVATLQKTEYAAIATLSKNKRENIVCIRSTPGNGLMLHYLWYGNEIAEEPNVQLVPTNANELKLATQLVESLAVKEFFPEGYRDNYRDRVMRLIESKVPNSKVAAPLPVKNMPVTNAVDLMALLTQSIANAKPKRQITLEDEPRKAVVKVKVKKGKAA